MVSVYGPRQTTRGSVVFERGVLNCDLKYAPFATRRRKHIPAGQPAQSPEEREASAILHRALEGAVRTETFPKATLDVYVLVLQSGGSDLALSITAASLAIAHAGVAMWDLVCACQVGSVGKRLLLDPSNTEEELVEARALVAALPLANEVTEVIMDGVWMDETAHAAVQLGLGGCLQLDEAMRACLREEMGE